MAIKAGRVGVNPADVDPISGRINSSSTEGYTKAEADDKFLAKSDASSTYLSQLNAADTYETKTDASTALAAKQPINLSVPISMLVGSQLVSKTTVESVLATMDGAMTNGELTDEVSPVEGQLSSSFTFADNHLIKVGKMVYCYMTLNHVTASDGDVIATIPDGFRPKYTWYEVDKNAQTKFAFWNSGNIKLNDTAISDRSIMIYTSWITS